MKTNYSNTPGSSPACRFWRCDDLLARRAIAWILVGLLFSLFLVFRLPAQSFGTIRFSDYFPTTQETLPHEVSEGHVRFVLNPRGTMTAPFAISLEGMNQENGRWQTLTLIQRPSAKLTRIKIPVPWQKAELRVIATYFTRNTGRVAIKSAFDPNNSSVSFSARKGAKLYSIEARPNSKAPWSRVSTVAAVPANSRYRIAIPAVIAAGSQVRVIAVLGASAVMPASIASSLPQAMREGPSRFGAQRAITSAPLQTSDTFVKATPVSADPGNPVSLMQESDIWKIRGDKIYFFNRLRGLQIIDSTDPSNPVIASMEIPASGEEMYLTGGDQTAAERALLITGVPWTPGATAMTRIHDISVASDTPSQLGSVDLPGTYVESRMVGNVLHVITTSWSSDTGVWQPRTFVSSINLTSGCIVDEQQILDVAASQVGATDKYLWLSAENRDYSANQTLYVFPIASNGIIGQPKQTGISGRIQDKFKVGDTSDGLAVVVQRWENWEQITSVVTYIENNEGLSASGQVELIRGESLYATRFDHDRCYVVTFRQIDPLWIVDLSVPANPVIRGHLEVPGWSTYIQPLGDVLIAVGRDGGKVQVSMFDVSNPDQPELAQRIDVGESRAWSEAEWNEKAVKILPESGLILMPVVENRDGAISQRVCLVDFDVTSRVLSLRGSINHDISPRRAALLDNGIIASVSNRQLLLVDAANRDYPVVVTDRLLAFGVDRLVLHQDVALMVENGASDWGRLSANAFLRTAPIQQIDAISHEIQLPCTSVRAAQVFEDRLVLIEEKNALDAELGVRRFMGYRAEANLSVWSLENPAHPTLISRISLPSESGSEAKILPISDGRIAIVSRAYGWHYWISPMPVVDIGAPMISVGVAASFPRMATGGKTLSVAIAEIQGDEPKVCGSWELEGDDFSGISEVFSNGDLLAFSFEKRESTKITSPQLFGKDGWTTSSISSWLQILDLADPSAPMAWAPVQLPGALVSIADWTRSGATVFARSGNRIAALGFNGETASIVAEATAGFTHVMMGSTLYFASSDGIAKREFSSLTGSWEPATIWPLNQASAVHSLYTTKGGLAAVSHNQAWILGADGSFLGYDILGNANFSAADRSGDCWVVPAGEYGPLVLKP